MLGFVRSIIGFGYNKTSSDDQLLEDAFETADDSPEEETNIVDKDSEDDFENEFKDILGKGRTDDDKWDEDWMAFDEEITRDMKQLLSFDTKNCSANGVVTQIVNDQQIVINNDKTVRFDRCNIMDLTVGDVVCVEKSGDNEVLVKPHRFMIRTGKVTDFDRAWNRFTFCRYAYISQKSAPPDLEVGQVLKCIVIETQNQGLHWRAYPYIEALNPDLESKDSIEMYTNEMTENKSGIEIQKDINFGTMNVDTKKSIFVWINNKSKSEHILESVDNEEGENLIRFKSFHLSYGKPVDRPFKIPPKKEVFVELYCEGLYCGDHKELIIFKFEGFKIGRFVELTVLDYQSNRGSAANDQMPKSDRNCDSTNYRRRHFGDKTWIIPGERLWPQNKHIIDRLPSYSIPSKVWQAMENNWNLEEFYPELRQPLNKENYRPRFHTLLYMEETSNANCLKKFDMSGVRLTKEGRFLTFSVPGLADGRPSLIMGDRVVLFEVGKIVEEKRVGFEGFIHEIRKDDILVRFNEEFHRNFEAEYKQSSFDVHFKVSRMVYRRCHHAIDLAPNLLDQVLFPINVVIKPSLRKVPISSINWFNPSLNIRQKLAVVGALNGESRPTPYIIFGPPGTGKTVTIVESILQVFDKLSHSRIIACTSANSSADLIVQKLLESGRVSDNDLIRITALHRVNAIPEEVKSVTQVADEDPKKWLYHRIIVTTTSQAGIVFRHKITPSHFTHVFIDEAGQVTEPESLIPITMSAIGHGVVVLAGDHQQLGPVVVCSKAKDLKLGYSLLERLMLGFKVYERNEKFDKYGHYNPKFVVKLVDNYRSDSQIMAISSKLFYDNELVFNTTPDQKLLKDMKLNSAINFIGVKGEDRQDPDCPSWFNPHEIIVASSFLDRLYEAGVQSDDIGIITPYRKQVTKLREHLNDMGIVECRVATIEEFQGLEKRVIIVSMVRSSELNLKHDVKYNLGFIHNAKRFNVAVSRAMSLLVVIGDPHLLERDRHWNALIQYCLKNQCYSGCTYRDFIKRNPGVKKRLEDTKPTLTAPA